MDPIMERLKTERRNMQERGRVMARIIRTMKDAERLTANLAAYSVQTAVDIELERLEERRQLRYLRENPER